MEKESQIKAQPLTTFDKILEWMVLIILAQAFIYVAVNYNNLPGQLGKSWYGGGGVSKNSLWFPFVITSLICWGIYKLNRHPELVNFSAKKDIGFRRKAYHLSTRLLRWISLILALAVSALTVTTVLTALGKLAEIPSILLPFFLILFIGITIFYVIKVLTLSKN